ncbi:DMT family transporter [Thermaerobacter sp. PB12/4term]|uniref:DMT family transporter n=1 Tax=Thermaerobacter sp. PB12/4term TaxID=2293838 RepID=UPI000E325340|nr:DMT family transporter [Thermaerobacter sp. PB12/4term]QIA26583.1 DMT family transporter [Thermaerobacter sp. PB12/4term]
MAYLLLALTPLLWAGNWTIAKELVRRVNPADLVMARWFLASLVLAPIVYLREGRLPRPQGVDWLWIALCGLTGMAGYNTLQYVAQQQTTNINGTLIYTASPALTFLLAVPLLGERVTPRRAAGVVLSLAGTAWILAGGSLEVLRSWRFNPGDVLMVVASAGWAVYTVVTRFGTRRLSPLSLTLYASAAGALMMAATRGAALATGRGAWSLSAGDTWAVLYIGVVSSAVAYLFWNEGVRRIGAGAASIFANLLPVYTAVLSTTLLDERLTLAHLTGGLAVLAGVYLVAAPAGGTRMASSRARPRVALPAERPSGRHLER